MPFELLELASFAVLHAFNSRDWQICLQSALSLHDCAMLTELPFMNPHGQALMYCAQVSSNSIIRMACKQDDVLKES